MRPVQTPYYIPFMHHTVPDYMHDITCDCATCPMKNWEAWHKQGKCCFYKEETDDCLFYLNRFRSATMGLRVKMYGGPRKIKPKKQPIQLTLF